MTKKAIFEEAIVIQNAVNLTAVLRAWRDARAALNEMDAPKNEREHLDVLYLSKVTSLLYLASDEIGSVTREGQDVFVKAFDFARQCADGKED